MALPLGATATTAASGGNREKLLGRGQRDASESEADAGSRNPVLARKRLRGLAVTERLKLRQQKAIMG